MTNMLNTGVSGLNAAQVALNTVGNNITNTNTPGYSRQVVLQSEQIAPSNGRYTIGSGVNVVSVQREYSAYLSQAAWNSNAGLQGATTYNNLATTLNSSLAASGNLQGALDGFYAASSAVANAPASASNRTALLGSAGALVSVFNTFAQQLSAQQGQLNSQINGTVSSINSAINNLAGVNQQIRQTTGGAQSNALLDQRDALANTLSGYLGVNAVTESDGTMSVYASNGQALVSGNHGYPLTVGGDPYDATRSDVFDSSGNNISGRVSGGTLGALLGYRSQVLDVTQNQLGQAAVALATSVNTQQAKGLDLNGQQGAPIFGVPAPTVLPATGNQGNASVNVGISDVSQLTAGDYKLSFDGSQWKLQTNAGQNVALTTQANGTLTADGLSFSVSGTAQAGDSYQIQPTRNAAAGLSVSLSNASGIAAAAALKVSASAGNSGTARAAAASVLDPTNPALLGAATVSFTSPGAYQITDAGGTVLASGAYTAGQPIAANGWSVTVSGTPAAGDSFSVAANNNGLNDNSNALALAGLADAGVLQGGHTSVINAYASLTTQIGNVGSQARSNLTTQTSLNAQAVSAQQSVSGVNLDQEAADMVRFQQAYQASAQVISASQTIFASLLSAVQTA
ncbi:MAG: flagellar hook-associated protein FlgK [Rhodanobacter sp.]